MRTAIILIILICFMINVAYYFHQYYVHTPIEYGYFWQYGYKEALSYARENEAKFDRVIMTYFYDQPYIYYLFYNKIDPRLHHSIQNQILIFYIFHRNIPGDASLLQ